MKRTALRAAELALEGQAPLLRPRILVVGIVGGGEVLGADARDAAARVAGEGVRPDDAVGARRGVERVGEGLVVRGVDAGQRVEDRAQDARVVDAVAGADHRAGVAAGPPGDAQARRDVVGVGVAQRLRQAGLVGGEDPRAADRAARSRARPAASDASSGTTTSPFGVSRRKLLMLPSRPRTRAAGRSGGRG